MNKQQMQWRGPYIIIKKVRENDYVSDIDGQNKMLHANVLHIYTTRNTVEEGVPIICGNRRLEIVVVAECDPVDSDNNEDLGEGACDK